MMQSTKSLDSCFVGLGRFCFCLNLLRPQFSWCGRSFYINSHYLSDINYSELFFLCFQLRFFSLRCYCQLLLSFSSFLLQACSMLKMLTFYVDCWISIISNMSLHSQTEFFHRSTVSTKLFDIMNKNQLFPTHRKPFNRRMFIWTFSRSVTREWRTSWQRFMPYWLLIGGDKSGRLPVTRVCCSERDVRW